MGILERPLRAQTAQGERIALARSETIPAGSTMEFEIMVLGQIMQGRTKVDFDELLTEWLNFGAWVGLGQWRGSGGYGQFEYEMVRQ